MFNGNILKGIREKCGLNRARFAALLQMSYGGFYKYETGSREPSSEVIEQMASLLGVPVEFFYGKNENLDTDLSLPDRTQSLLELTDRLDKARFERKNQDQRIAELEKQNERLMATFELKSRYADIMRLDVSKEGRAKKSAALVRSTAQKGTFCLAELVEILGIGKATIKRWLLSLKSTYVCRLFNERTVEAFLPDEAGVRLNCFDCDARAEGDCNGYGNPKEASDFFSLIALFEANGIDDRNEQAKLLREFHDMDLTGHQISEYISRRKLGKPVPLNIINMQSYKRPNKRKK